MNVLVVGVGHSLRGDDAAGLDVVSAWQRNHSKTASLPGVRVELMESPGIELATLLQGAEAAVLVDSVRSGAPVGKLHRLLESDIADLVDASGSIHGWGVPEALKMARALGFQIKADKLVLLGIEASQMNVGAAMSPEVSSVISTAAAALDSEVQALLAS